MRPDRFHRRSLALRAALVGGSLGVLLFAAGSLILYQAAGALDAAGGLVATFAAALAAGLWAGAPGARADRPPLGRWVFAGVAQGIAGVFGTLWAIMEAERFGHPARAMALLFLVGLPVYAAGLLFPSLVAWEAGEDDDAAPDPADAARPPGAAGTAAVGALVGLGIGAAAAGLFLLPALNPGPLMLASGAVLTFPLLFPVRRRAEGGDRLLYEEETPFGTLRVAEVVFPGQRQPELRLYQDEEIESGELARTGAPTFAYIAAAERWLQETTPAGASYLFLGGGAYTLPRRVAERDPSARITVVELDPAVTAAAYRFFGLRPEHGVVSLHGDARRVAEGLPPASFDRVFLDVYDGTETVPLHLATREAMALWRGLLRPGGTLLMNVIGVADGPGSVRLWSTVRTVAEAFPALSVYSHLPRDFPDRQNFLVAASADGDAAFPRAAGPFERWPRESWPAPGGTAAFRDAYDGAPQTEAAAPERDRGERRTAAS